MNVILLCMFSFFANDDIHFLFHMQTPAFNADVLQKRRMGEPNLDNRPSALCE